MLIKANKDVGCCSGTERRVSRRNFRGHGISWLPAMDCGRSDCNLYVLVRARFFKVVVRNPQRVRRIRVQTKPEQITPVFASETQFNVRTIVVGAQSEVIEEPIATSLLPTSAIKTLEQKGVPFSALHD